VAGSTARGESEAAQRLLAQQLLASRKDREEHRIAREDMVARLRPLAEQVRACVQDTRGMHLELEVKLLGES